MSSTGRERGTGGERHDTATAWLSIVGIGEDGPAGLSPRALAALANAELIAGGTRHLALIEALPGRTDARRLAWPSPYEAGIADILACRGRPVVVLASGDPFQHGIGSVLARHVALSEMWSAPQPSAFSLAANRLGWALQDTVCVSLTTGPVATVLPHLAPGARMIVLSAGAGCPARIAALLSARGFGASKLIILERMGGPYERVIETTAAAFTELAVAALNTVAIDIPRELHPAPGPVLGLAAGRPDDLFEHDGQLTKAPVRAITLASLAPRRGAHLWDIGSGSGAVAVEWMLCGAGCRATAIERDPARARRAGANALRLGVPGLRLVIGEAPAALAGLEAPDAVFIGGGARDSAVVEAAWAALRRGGRLVVNAVTLQTEAVVLALHARLGGSLSRIAIAHASPVGRLTGWRPAMPLLHWRAEKP